MAKLQGKRLLFIVSLLMLLVVSLHSSPARARSEMELTGDIVQIILPATAGLLSYYRDDYEGTAQFAKSFFTTLGVTYCLKYSIDAKRPYGGDHSFPSGHTSAAFSGASFLQKRYGWEYGLPAYAAAAFVGWSRVASNNHHIQDVIAGAAIGILSTYFFTDEYQKDVAITPFVGEGTYGLMLHYSL